MNNNDKIFEEIARIYAEEDGKRLLAEADKADDKYLYERLPRLKKRVFGTINRNRSRKYFIPAAGFAACLLAGFIFLYSYLANRPETGSEQIADAGKYEIIQLSCELPNNLRISNVEQDKEKTIYLLADENRNDVVLTVEKTDKAHDFGGLQKLRINGHDAYGTATADYSLVTFEQGDLYYSMTCKYDSDTLIRLSKSILL